MAAFPATFHLVELLAVGHEELHTLLRDCARRMPLGWPRRLLLRRVRRRHVLRRRGVLLDLARAPTRIADAFLAVAGLHGSGEVRALMARATSHARTNASPTAAESKTKLSATHRCDDGGGGGAVSVLQPGTRRIALGEQHV